MWFLIQMLVLVGSFGSFAFTMWTDNKTKGLVRAAAHTTVGSTGKVVFKMVSCIVVMGIFARLGWYPLAISVFVTMVSLMWAWSSPKSLEDFE